MKRLKRWHMYFTIHNLKAKGLKVSQIARKLNISKNTVYKYLSMSPKEFEQVRESTVRALGTTTNFVPKKKLSMEEGLAGEPLPLSQLGQALQLLDITHIKAMTPQPSGLIERLFQTLQTVG